MKTALISFSRTGYNLGEKIAEGLRKLGYEAEQYTKSEYTEKTSAYHVDEPVKEWTARMFGCVDALIYIGACGIAVRSIAPYVKDKKTDPAVIVADEEGNYVISLLSGHIGGANQLTKSVAGITGGQPVITTATDIHEKFAVDMFAKKNNCYISDMKYAKEISAAILEGKTVGFYSEFPWLGELPEGLKLYDENDGMKPELGIAVTTAFAVHPYVHTLYLVPKVLSLGIGCRRGTSKEAIEETVRKVCNEMLIPFVAMEQIATIDIKRDEPGLTQYCAQRNIPMVTFSAEELKRAEGKFEPSKFVEATVGVDNVCERSAVLASGNGRLVHRKYADQGVTAAISMKKWSVNFE